jgi:hypothetical protein
MGATGRYFLLGLLQGFPGSADGVLPVLLMDVWPIHETTMMVPKGSGVTHEFSG